MHIVITSHGSFCTGTISSYQMVAGKSNNITGVSLSSVDTGQFRYFLRKTVEQYLDGGVLILCDIVGGTPYNESYRLMLEHPRQIRLLANVNLPMLIEAGLSISSCKNIDELCETVARAGTESMKTAVIAPEDESTNKEIENFFQ
jgi:mannose/fructose-specific phosphotransferase system component IIA